MQGIDLRIETIKRTSEHIDYVDAVVILSEETGMDFEDIVKQIHSSTKEKIKHDFVKRNMVPGEKHIPSLENFME